MIEVRERKQVDRIAGGRRPRGIAVSQDGTRLYVSNQEVKTQKVVDVATKAVRATVAIDP